MDRSLKELLKEDYQKLYPTQEEAFKKGILGDRNFVISIPTASGKTLIAEICMLDKLIK
ncbi:MAG: DEAD/DEAH box helicase, partial [Candidatus Odinarchaeia archaeon]